MPLVDNFDAPVCQIVYRSPARSREFPGFFFLVCVLLSYSRIQTMDTKKGAMGKSALRRKSMELLKDMTQILREILSSGDEEGLRQLEKTIRALEQTRRKPGSHAIH